MNEPLTKHLSNEVTATLSEQGVLTLTEVHRVDEDIADYDGSLLVDEPVTTSIALPDYAVRALLNFLLRNIVRGIIGHRRWQGSKPDRK